MVSYSNSFIIRLSISGNWIESVEIKTKWMLNAESEMCWSRLLKWLQRYFLTRFVMWNMFNVQEHFKQKRRRQKEHKPLKGSQIAKFVKAFQCSTEKRKNKRIIKQFSDEIDKFTNALAGSLTLNIFHLLAPIPEQDDILIIIRMVHGTCSVHFPVKLFVHLNSV